MSKKANIENITCIFSDILQIYHLWSVNRVFSSETYEEI